jgi:hypothetical protein
VRLRSWPGTGFDGGTSWIPYAPDRSNRRWRRRRRRRRKKKMTTTTTTTALW